MNATLPDIYLFNPTCEYAVANGRTSWQPNLLLQKMEEDLTTLPLFFAKPGDVVLVKKMPPVDYVRHLEQSGIEVPEFFRIREIATGNPFLGTPKNRLVPWGWSPAAHRLLDPLKPSCSAQFISSPVAHWKPEYREIYSKKFAAGILRSILPLLPPEKVLPAGLLPEICTSAAEIEELLSRWGRLMIKAPWSSSGRGLQPVTKTPVVPKVWEKLMGIVSEQGYVVAEPYLDKVADLALQFSLSKGNIEFKGISRFITDSKGQYQGNYLNGWPPGIDPEAVGFAEELPAMLVPALVEAAGRSRLMTSYEGSFGIDTLIYRNTEGQLRVNPCLEINVRQNMGLLSLHLEKLLVPGVKAVFKIFYQKGKTFYLFQKEMTAAYPPKFNGNLLESGFYPLTPADETTLFGAYLMAG